MIKRPPIQTVAPTGVKAFGPMGAQLAHPGHPITVLRAVAETLRFQQFAAQQIGKEPMTTRRTVDEVMRYVGAQSWSQFMTQECLTKFCELMQRYQSTF